MSQISKNIQQVLNNIKKTAEEYKCDASDVSVIAVSKKQPEERIEEMLQAGHRVYGENRVQEAQGRWLERKNIYKDLKLHLIGPLQTNKVKDAITLFDVIHTVDRPKLVKALAKEMKVQKKELEFFIQVNTGQEGQKSGVIPEHLGELLDICVQEGLNIIGLMCIPPVDEASAVHFAFLKKLADQYSLKNLSMGMSGDYQKAIPLGATHIRVGTSLFGIRPDQT